MFAANNTVFATRLRNRSILYLLFLIGISLVLFGSSLPTAAQSNTHDDEAQARIEAAWAKIEDVDSYGYRTQLEQSVYPIAGITTAGQPPRVDSMAMEGLFDLAEERFEATLWGDTSFDPNRGHELLIENGQSYMRSNSQSEWEEVDLGDSFAPGGDPMSFLAGLSNVQSSGTDTRDLGAFQLEFEKYTFDLNGPAFAAYVERLTAQMSAENGRLPRGFESGPNTRLRQSEGHGSIWINAADGMIARLDVEITFPADEATGPIVGHIVSDFYDYQLSEAAAPPSLLTAPLARLQFAAVNIAQPQNAFAVGWLLLLTLSLLLVTTLVWQTAHTKAFHATVASLVIAGMVLPPLLHAKEAHAFFEEQIEQSAVQQEQIAEQEAYQDMVEKASSNDWNPHMNPLGGGDRFVETALAYEVAAVTSDDIDSDGDGVSDAYELDWGSCPYLISSSEYSTEANCEGVTDVTDSDLDGLGDFTEITQLGTLPDEWDSDGDTITDTLEVGGFDYNGTTWYLDPLRIDTNNDGVHDGAECVEFLINDGSVCGDVDGDGTPDAFDEDNDGDGVLDRDDPNPDLVVGPFDYDTPFELEVDGLEVDKPVLVDLQFRTQDTDLLTASGLVLDWADRDYEGQFVRVLDTTFASTTNSDIRSEAGNAAYGDIRVTPMLEVTIPYEAGHYGNLPITDTMRGVDRQLGDTIEDWLDSTELDELNINVYDLDEDSGDLAVHIPLYTNYSQVGGLADSFTAKMLYMPSQGSGGVADWGSTHEYRLVWYVQMIIDQCAEEFDGDIEDDDYEEDYQAYLYECDREELLTLMHVYEDEVWELAGLTVSEEHGLTAATLYEDPAQDPDLDMADQLFLYSWNMGNIFVDGRDCDSTDANGDCIGDGVRDVTLADLPDALDDWGTDEDDVNQNYVAIDLTQEYLHADYMSYVAISDTVAVLDDVFLPYKDTMPHVSLITAYETSHRQLDMGQATIGSSGELSFDFTLDEALETTMAGMQWYNFEYDATTESWDKADEEVYLEYFLDYLVSNSDYFMFDETSDEADEMYTGKLLLAQNYYLSLSRGLVGFVELDNVAFNVPSADASFIDAEVSVAVGVAQTSAMSRITTMVYYYIADRMASRSGLLSGWSKIHFIYSMDYFANKNIPGLTGLTSGVPFVVDDVNGVVTTGAGSRVPSTYSSYKLLGSKRLARFMVQDSMLRMVKASVALFIVGALLVAVGAFAGFDEETSTILVTIGMAMILLAGVVMAVIEGLSLVSKGRYVTQVLSIVVAQKGKFRMAKRFFAKARALVKAYPIVMAGFAFLISVALAIGIYIASLYALGGNPPQYQINTLTANLIATIIVELIFFLVIFIPVIGPAIYAFLELLDLLILFFNYVTNGDAKGLRDILIEELAEAIYDFDMYATNLNDDDRLDLDFSYALTEDRFGYTLGNGLVMTTAVTNTLHGGLIRDFGTNESVYEDLTRKNAFAYAFTFDPTSLDDLELDDRDLEDEWVRGTYTYSTYIDNQNASFMGSGDSTVDTDDGVTTKATVSISRVMTLEVPFADLGTGINRVTPQTYFIEKYNVTGEGCWFGSIDCGEDSFEDTGVTEYHQFTFDIVPSTMGEFIDFDWVGEFRLQYDRDGDGLLSTQLGGADPSDGSADMDGDGISDYIEILNSLNASEADADGDGLNDYEELYQYNTHPDYADTDGDGLSDYIEAKHGWLVGYIDENGVTQTTRVWSDPWTNDIDLDGLGDLEEYIYGFNPQSPDDPAVLDTLIDIEDIDLEETGGPLFLLKMEDGANDLVISDLSGNGRSFGCDDSNGKCPTRDVDGVYGQGFEFDGSTSQLTATLDIPVTEFTAAAWIYPYSSGSGGSQTIMGDSRNGTQRSVTMMVNNVDDIRVSFGDGSTRHQIDAVDVVTLDSWNHVATTFDGTTYIIYVNGVPVLSDLSAAGVDPQDLTDYYIGYRDANVYFNGKLDEVTLYDRALDSTEIGMIQDGRYNTNDLIVTPGAELTYQATITNNNTARSANGFLFADTGVTNPEAPTPLVASGFELEQRLAYFPSEIELGNWATADSLLLACIDDGSCPVENSAGFDGNSFEFDGVDDYLTTPQFTDASSTSYIYGPHIFFWLYIDSYPTSGRATILDTDSTNAAAVDIELNSGGRLIFDSHGYEDVRSPTSVPTGMWNLIGLLGGEIYIDNGTNFGDQTSNSGTHYQPQIGPGRIGNNMAGDQPFDGRIDDLIIYYDDISYLDLSSAISDIYSGDYRVQNANPDEEINFEALFADVKGFTGISSTSDVYYTTSQSRQFVDTTVENGGFLSCVDDGHCPTAGVSGPFGNGVEFDGSDDFLTLPRLTASNVAEVVGDETHIHFWLYADAYPTSGKAMIIDSDSTEDGAMDVYIDASGYLHFDSMGYADGVSPSPIGQNSWVHVSYTYGRELYIDGSSVGNVANVGSSYQYPAFGPGRLGNSMAGDEPFDGRIDELVIYHGSNGASSSLIAGNIYQGDYFQSSSGLRADAVFQFEELINDDTNSNVGYLNLATGLRDANCADSGTGCPAVATGIYGDGLTFDGSNDGLQLRDLDFAKADYTIGYWFKSVASSTQAMFSAADSAGLAIQAALNGSGQVEMVHRFPGAASGGVELTSSAAYNDGSWHYYTAVKDGTTLSIYLDGVLAMSQTAVATAATEPLSLSFGYDLTTASSFWNGSLDELVILDEAVGEAGVQYLMASQYPAIAIDETFSLFSLSPFTTTTVSGSAVVAENVANGSVHRFTEEVEAAFDFEVDIVETTFLHDSANEPSDGSDLSGYFRFEEIPGSTNFNNQLLYNVDQVTQLVEDTTELDATCLAGSCPVSGVRGVDGRALYFDGYDDYLLVDMTSYILEQTDGNYQDIHADQKPEAQSVSMWVKGTEGTLFNRGVAANSSQFQIDMGRVSYLSSFDDYLTADFEMPLNEWTHLVVTLSDEGRLKVWVNGELRVDAHTYLASAATSKGNWVIGANHGTQNHYEGFIDELYIYDVELDEAAVQSLFSSSVPVIRFNFDEESDEKIFVDEIQGYVAEPVSTQCVPLSLETLTVQQLDDTLTNIALDVDGEQLYYGSVADFGAVVTDTTAVSLTLNIETPICAASVITARGVYSDGTTVTFSGSATASVAETATTDVTFSNSAEQVTLAYSNGALFDVSTPLAGIDGRIGNTVYFPSYGDGYLDVLNSEGLGDFSTDDFTIMTWVKTDESNNPIWSKNNGDGDNDNLEKILTIVGNGTLQLISRGNGQPRIVSTEPITDGLWHHVAVTWDYDGTGTTGTGAIYVDGVDVTDSTNTDYSAVNADDSGHSWQIGRRGTGSGPDFFNGQLDEFTAYLGRALSAAETNETYLREARWYYDLAEFSVLVDDDVPTMTVQTTYEYLDTGYAQLVMSPSDPTSNIALVQFGVKGPSDSGYIWDTADKCADSSIVYCPVFLVSDEGVHELIYRIVDVVGNQTISDIYEYYVDLTGVTVSGSASAAAEAPQLAALAHTDSRVTTSSTVLDVTVTESGNDRWVATFGGTVTDPDIVSGVAGSGVSEDRFYITVYNALGDIVGVPSQAATVSGDSGVWTIDYVIEGFAPAGSYTVEVTAYDVSGNESTSTIGTFTADKQSPHFSMARGIWSDSVISDTHDIYGIIIDQYKPLIPILMFHFEEASGVDQFYSYGQVHHTFACETPCATTTTDALFGRGLDFDGTAGWSLDNDVYTNVVDYNHDQDFSISLWVQADVPQTVLTQTTNTLIEKWGDGVEYPFSIQYHNQGSGHYGYVTAQQSNGMVTRTVTSTVSIADGSFHHVALVNDGDTLALYVDGVKSEATIDLSAAETMNDGVLSIGSRPGTADYNFSGVIDEVMVDDSVWSADEVYALAQDSIDGLGSMEVAFEQIDFASYPDYGSIDGRQGDVSWSSVTLDQPSALASIWRYTLSDMEDFYYIHARGRDAGSNEATAKTVWQGVIDHVAPTLNVTGQQVGYGDLQETVYTITFSDLLLDFDSLVSPCGEFDLTSLTYNDADLIHNGLPYEVSGSCTAEGWQSSATFKVCDVVGHCTELIVTPAVSTDLGAIQILTPTVAMSDTVAGTPVEVAGAAVAANGLQTITIAVDDLIVETFSYTASVTETTWSTTSWAPAVTGTYTVTAWLTDTLGNGYRDQLTLTFGQSTSDGSLTLLDVGDDGTDLTFTWSAENGAGCEVTINRSTTSPYSGFTTWATAESSPTVVSGSAGDMAYYYLSAEGCAQELVDSETMGVFSFSLTAGD